MPEVLPFWYCTYKYVYSILNNMYKIFMYTCCYTCTSTISDNRIINIYGEHTFVDGKDVARGKLKLILPEKWALFGKGGAGK